MTNKKQSNWGLKLLNILCLISAVIYLIAFIGLVFNIGGVADRINSILINQMQYAPSEADAQVTMFSFEFIISASFAFYCARYYKITGMYVRDEKELGKKVIIMGVFQLLFGMVITGIIAIIVGIVKVNSKKVVMETKQDYGIPEQKLELMSQAVERLKKLREIGAISEEEYYINLNKILEG